MSFSFLSRQANKKIGPVVPSWPASSAGGATVLWNRLAVLCFLSALGVTGYGVRGMVFSQPPVLPEIALIESRDGAQEPPSAPSEFPPFDSYTALWAGRDIFQSAQSEGTQQEQPPEPDAASLAVLSQQYKLVGVILDRQPRAVVETRNSPSTTRFLSPGDHLGEAILEKVEQGQAWFRYQGQQVPLKFETDAPQ